MIEGKIHKIMDKFNLRIAFTHPKPFERFAVKGENLVGVEIGVFNGRHALHLLKKLSIKKLYLIDPYEVYNEYQGEEMGGEDNIIKAKGIAKKKLKWFNNIVWVYKKSSECLNDIPNNIDFIYLDNNHSYKIIKKDIEDYWGKVKVGGVMGGHDINFICVANAVSEFVVKHNLDLNIRMDDWWVVKNRNQQSDKFKEKKE